MKKLLIFTVCFLMATVAAFGVKLQTSYDKAGPGDGYDKLLVLDPNETYTGSCGVLIGKKSCIRGNGALVDLDGGNIQAGRKSRGWNGFRRFFGSRFVLAMIAMTLAVRVHAARCDPSAIQYSSRSVSLPGSTPQMPASR